MKARMIGRSLKRCQAGRSPKFKVEPPAYGFGWRRKGACTPMPIRFLRYAIAGLLLLVGLGRFGYASDDLKIVLLDSKDGHALKGKLVCISWPGDAYDPVVQHRRDCQRTDSGGTATFSMDDPVPPKVDVTLSSNGLISCFSPETFDTADAMKGGMVARNTCGSASTDTTEDGEVVVFAHQKSLKEAVNSVRNEF